MSRHTKIVATLGPASSDLLTLERMVHAGLDVVRMNFSHGKPEDHVARAETIRDASARAGRPIGILADLQGPKIRVGKFEEGRVTLTRDAPFILDATATLLRRALRGEKVWQAHRTHYYQRMVQMGLGHRGTALRAYGLMAGCGAAAVVALTAGFSLQCIIITMCITVHFFVAYRIDRAWRRHRAGESPPP
jgi:hypothetical protein